MIKNNTEVVTPKTEYNWLPIILIGGAIFFFTQHGFDLSSILPGSKATSTKLDIKEPSSEYKTAELVSFQNEVGKNKKKAALTAAFYFAFADILSRNPDLFQTTQQLRTQHSKALDLAFKNDPALADPEIGSEIESYLQKFIPLEPKPIEIEKVKNCFLALAWAANNA